jgi:hypothetical protein
MCSFDIITTIYMHDPGINISPLLLLFLFLNDQANCISTP